MKFTYNQFKKFFSDFCLYVPSISLELDNSVIEDLFTNYNSNSSYKLLEKKGSILERHFDTAALMVSIINSKIGKNNKLIKEKIATLVGILALRNHIDGDNKNDADSGFISFLEKNKNFFVFPQGYSWEHHWAEELHDAHGKNEISIKYLAKELFWLEEYNRLKSQI